MRVIGLAPVLTCLRRTGAPVERLLAHANVPLRAFDAPEALIPVSQAFRFVETAACVSGIECLELLGSREMQIDALGMFGRLIRRSPTLGDALEVLIGTMPAFASGGRSWLTRFGDRARLCHKLVGSLDAGRPQADHYWLMLALGVVRLAEPLWRPDDVSLETRAVASISDVEVLSEARVAFAQRETAFTFPYAFLRRPLARAGVVRRIEDTEVETWKASAPANDFPGSVLQVMTMLSSPDYPRIGSTADAIGMSVRALQRRLAQAGASYERLVAESRFGTAVHLLARTDATVLDIALDLGYSDHAHFTRAFRRWAGVPPRAFRQMSRRAGDA
jgi:AraC-like DNA-binding protein